VTTVLSALGQMLDGFGRVDDVEVEGAVLVDDDVDAEAEAVAGDDADVDVGEDEVITGPWFALSVGASYRDIRISVKGKVSDYFRVLGFISACLPVL
jgi:hypothetical protein